MQMARIEAKVSFHAASLWPSPDDASGVTS